MQVERIFEHYRFHSKKGTSVLLKLDQVSFDYILDDFFEMGIGQTERKETRYDRLTIDIKPTTLRSVMKEKVKNYRKITSQSCSKTSHRFHPILLVL